jgi:hypothetical protein
VVRWRYRATDFRISSAVLVRTNGFGSAFVAAMWLLTAGPIDRTVLLT